MSIEVALDDLAEAIGRRRGQAYLATVRVTEDGLRPHLVSVAPAVGAAGTLVVGAGRKTAANVAAEPEVTLLWPTDEDDPKHSLLVDATATASADGESLVLVPRSAILHRLRAADATRSPSG